MLADGRMGLRVREQHLKGLGWCGRRGRPPNTLLLMDSPGARTGPRLGAHGACQGLVFNVRRGSRTTGNPSKVRNGQESGREMNILKEPPESPSSSATCHPLLPRSTNVFCESPGGQTGSAAACRRGTWSPQCLRLKASTGPWAGKPTPFVRLGPVREQDIPAVSNYLPPDSRGIATERPGRHQLNQVARRSQDQSRGS